jgi:hypothetical protein
MDLSNLFYGQDFSSAAVPILRLCIHRIVIATNE